MKKALSMILTIALVLALFSGSALAVSGNGNGNGNGKDKVKASEELKEHWGKHAIEKLQSKGVLKGYEDGSIQPDKTLTQGELAVIIARLLDAKHGDDDDQDLEEEDSDDDDGLKGVPGWAKKAVKEGVDKNYLNLKRFHSEVQCTRVYACVMLAKALELKPVDLNNDIQNPFKDRLKISDEDYGYLLALYKAGYIKGYPDGNFNPNTHLTRAQIAAILDKLPDDDEVTDDDNEPTWSKSSFVTAAAVYATSVKLEWSAAKDDVKVVGYKVRYKVDGKEKVKYVAGRTATITGLEPDEDYTFTVQARDAAGNWSDDGPSVDITTLEEDEEDTAEPTWPKGAKLTISASTSGIVTIIWPNATDNVGVDSYQLYRDGQLIKTLDGDVNSTNVPGPDSDTKYTFKLRAVDSAGNVSSSLTKTYFTD